MLYRGALVGRILQIHANRIDREAKHELPRLPVKVLGTDVFADGNGEFRHGAKARLGLCNKGFCLPWGQANNAGTSPAQRWQGAGIIFYGGESKAAYS
jgi:hypothetical protein